jgi:hypothetical protein
LCTELETDKRNITLHVLNELLKNPPAQYEQFASFYRSHKEKITGIQNQISLLVTAPFAHLFKGDEINLMRAYHERKIVYFALDPLTSGETCRRVGNLITGDLNTLCGLVQKSEFRNELAVYVDEYGSFGTDQFALTLAQGRSAGFMVTISHQSTADLRKIGPEHAEVVKANTNTRIVLKANTRDTEDFCTEAGTYRDLDLTRQVTITGHQDGVEMGNEKVVDVHHINAQELRQLVIGQAGYKTPSRQGLVQLTYCGYPDDILKTISFPDRSNRTDPEPPVDQKPRNDQKKEGPGSIFNI